MERVLLTGFMKMELRDGRTVRLCDGNFFFVDGELYQSSDPVFGTIGSMDVFKEGVGDEVPNFRMTFLPANTAAAAALSAPGMQGSRVRFWIAELDMDTGAVLGTPDLQFDGQIDRTILRIGRGKRELDMELVSTAARMLALNEGNTLNPRFHKLINPGEKGEDNATGLGIGVAWGTESQVSSGGILEGLFGD